MLHGPAGHNRSPETVKLRNYTPPDAEGLVEVYRDAARVLGRQAYTDEQTRVWAMHPEDLEQFRSALSEGFAICAVVDGSPVAFGELNPVDHIAYLYCHSAYSRRGFGSAILARLEEYAKSNLAPAIRVEASCVARLFFERFGYRIVAEERPIRHRVEFLRFKMEKELVNQQVDGTR
jgi:putative acetyltransferase